MADLPVMLKVSGRRCVVVGGGPVAARRTRSLLDAGAQVTVVAPALCEAFAEVTGHAHAARAYGSGDLRGAVLAVVATHDPAVNAMVGQDAAAAGVLVNRADDPDSGDLTIPAHAHHGPVTIAAHTGGISASASAAIRRQLSDALDPRWPRLLELVAPYRGRAQAAIDDPVQRQGVLRKLADEQALALLENEGEAAVVARCERLLASG